MAESSPSIPSELGGAACGKDPINPESCDHSTLRTDTAVNEVPADPVLEGDKETNNPKMKVSGGRRITKTTRKREHFSIMARLSNKDRGLENGSTSTRASMLTVEGGTMGEKVRVVTIPGMHGVRSATAVADILQGEEIVLDNKQEAHNPSVPSEIRDSDIEGVEVKPSVQVDQEASDFYLLGSQVTQVVQMQGDPTTSLESAVVARISDTTSSDHMPKFVWHAGTKVGAYTGQNNPNTVPVTPGCKVEVPAPGSSKRVKMLPHSASSQGERSEIGSDEQSASSVAGRESAVHGFPCMWVAPVPGQAITDRAAELKVGDSFNTWSELKAVLDEFQRINKVKLSKTNSKTAEGKNRKLSAHAQKYPSEHVYANAQFGCIHSGKARCRSIGIRMNQKTIKLECPARIYVTSDRLTKKLVIKAFNNNHNHELSDEIIKIPTYGYPPLETRKPDRSMVDVNVFRQHVYDTRGNLTTMTDLHSLRSSLHSDETEVEAVFQVFQDFLTKDEGGKLALVLGDDGSLEGMFLQTSAMATAFRNYPETLYLDSARSANNSNVRLFSVSVADGDGTALLGGHVLFLDQTKASLVRALQIFKQHTPHVQYGSVSTIVIDQMQDASEVAAGAQQLPDEKLLGETVTLSQLLKKLLLSSAANSKRKPKGLVRRTCPIKKAYQQACTVNGSKLIFKQLSQAKSGKYKIQTKEDGTFSVSTANCTYTVNSTCSECSCGYLRSVGIPCSHIFAARKERSLELFDLSLVAERWLKTTKSHGEKAELQEQDVVTSEALPPREPMSREAKYKETLELGKELAEVISLCEEPEYSRRLEQMCRLLHYYKSNTAVRVTCTSPPEGKDCTSGSHHSQALPAHHEVTEASKFLLKAMQDQHEVSCDPGEGNPVGTYGQEAPHVSQEITVVTETAGLDAGQHQQEMSCAPSEHNKGNLTVTEDHNYLHATAIATGTDIAGKMDETYLQTTSASSREASSRSIYIDGVRVVTLGPKLSSENVLTIKQKLLTNAPESPADTITTNVREKRTGMTGETRMTGKKRAAENMNTSECTQPKKPKDAETKDFV